MKNKKLMEKVLEYYREVKFTADYKEKALTMDQFLLLELTEHVLQNEPEAAETFARYAEIVKTGAKPVHEGEKGMIESSCAINIGHDKNINLHNALQLEIVEVTTKNKELEKILDRFETDAVIEAEYNEKLYKEFKEQLQSDQETILALEKTIIKLSK